MAPKLAPRLRMFISTALSGTTTEPVIMNSNTSVASTTTPPASGSRAPSLSLTSRSSAAGPADLGVEARGFGADPVDERGCLRTLRSARRNEVDDGEPGRRTGPGRRTDDAVGRDDTSASQATNAGSSASVPATTVTGSVPRAGNRSARTRAVARTSDERGSVRASPFSKRALRNGIPSRTRSSPDGATDLQRPALHPPGEPVEPALGVGHGEARLDTPAGDGQCRRQQRDRGRHATAARRTGRRSRTR